MKNLHSRTESEFESTKDYSSLIVSLNQKKESTNNVTVTGEYVASYPKSLKCKPQSQLQNTNIISKIESCDKRLENLHKDFAKMHNDLKNLLSKNNQNHLNTSSFQPSFKDSFSTYTSHQPSARSKSKQSKKLKQSSQNSEIYYI